MKESERIRRELIGRLNADMKMIREKKPTSELVKEDLHSAFICLHQCLDMMEAGAYELDIALVAKEAETIQGAVEKILPVCLTFMLAQAVRKQKKENSDEGEARTSDEPTPDASD